MRRLAEVPDAFRFAVAALRANLARSILTSAGIIIGITFVVLMGWAIKGIDAMWEQTISIIGKDMIYIDKWDWAGGRNWRKLERRRNVTYEQAVRASERIESAELVMPLVRRWGGRVSVGNSTLMCSVLGTTASYGRTPAGDIASGRYFSEIEEQHGMRVVVLGHGVAKNLFPDGGAIGRTLRIGKAPFLIVGVAEKRGYLMMDFVDNQVLIPIMAYRGLYGFAGANFSVAVKTGSERMLDIVRDEAVGVMRTIRNVPPLADNDFSINEMKAFDEQVATIRLWIWGVGLSLSILAFIVGSIGIMNIMFVSVTERTKEIGIRKAIGARRSSILVQFLIESAVLCCAGALVALPLVQGIITLARWVMISLLQFEEASVIPSLLPADLLGLAIGVSIVVGLLAGLIPALRAAHLDPVEALRFE